LLQITLVKKPIQITKHIVYCNSYKELLKQK